MANITVLDQNTINKIAAGEVIERPASVVKELLENAIDARATAVTIEIKDGGCSLIRVTDNGCGIPGGEIPLAFVRHATSKIKTVEDLFTVSSLGFRGEALASIAAVAQVELITKVNGELTGTRYQIEGGLEKGREEIGAPEGTTIIVKNLFYNTPARKKFLKTPVTEGAHVAALAEKIALSHPGVSIRFIQNNQNKLYTSGNHNLKDLIYTVFGREIAANLLNVDVQGNGTGMEIRGYIGKPVIARANRNYENYFINGRYIKSSIISKAIEEAYKPFMMQHKYPFTMLHFSIDPQTLDVNVHPTKMELRFSDGEQVYRQVLKAVGGALAQKELIPEVDLEDKAERESKKLTERLAPKPEPFELNRKRQMEHGTDTRDARTSSFSYNQIPPPRPSYVNDIMPEWLKERKREQAAAADRAVSSADREDGFAHQGAVSANRADSAAEEYGAGHTTADKLTKSAADGIQTTGSLVNENTRNDTDYPGIPQVSLSGQTSHGQEEPEISSESRGQAAASAVRGQPEKPEQLDLFDGKLLDPRARLKHRLIGQLFDTYWMVEYNEQLFIIDQHAAHEKVLYEKTIRTLKTRRYDTQMVEPPIILTLNMNEELLLKKYMSYFTGMGFEIEYFGGKEYAVRGVPANLFSIAKKELLIEMLDGLSDDTAIHNPDIIYEKVASMSCKAAVKGHHRMSALEANQLIDQLLELENPYACPHGRPTIISMSKYELEKKFKRIV